MMDERLTIDSSEEVCDQDGTEVRDRLVPNLNRRTVSFEISLRETIVVHRTQRVRASTHDTRGRRRRKSQGDRRTLMASSPEKAKSSEIGSTSESQSRGNGRQTSTYHRCSTRRGDEERLVAVQSNDGEKRSTRIGRNKGFGDGRLAHSSSSHSMNHRAALDQIVIQPSLGLRAVVLVVVQIFSDSPVPSPSIGVVPLAK